MLKLIGLALDRLDIARGLVSEGLLTCPFHMALCDFIVLDTDRISHDNYFGCLLPPRLLRAY